MKRNIPYSAKKVKLRAKKQFYLGMIRKREERRIDEYALKKKQEIAKIEIKELSREEIQILYEEAVNEWNEHKNNIAKNREDKLLDSYSKKIIGDSEEKRKRRRKVIKTIKKPA